MSVSVCLSECLTFRDCPCASVRLGLGGPDLVDSDGIPHQPACVVCPPRVGLYVICSYRVGL